MKPLLLSAALMIALGTSAANAQNAETLPLRVTDFAKTEAVDDHTIGSEDAAITMIIWASINCTHCGQWFTEEWPTVKSELVETGKLRVVFRELRTGNMEVATIGFMLAECAPTEDYMSIIEYQMENQKDIFKALSEGRAREVYANIGKMAGMETTEAIETCVRNPDIQAHIIDNENRAAVAEVAGVPAFFVNGGRYKGRQDAQSLVALITDMEEKRNSALPETTEPAKANAGQDNE